MCSERGKLYLEVLLKVPFIRRVKVLTAQDCTSRRGRLQEKKNSSLLQGCALQSQHSIGEMGPRDQRTSGKPTGHLNLERGKHQQKLDCPDRVRRQEATPENCPLTFLCAPRPATHTKPHPKFNLKVSGG